MDKAEALTITARINPTLQAILAATVSCHVPEESSLFASHRPAKLTPDADRRVLDPRLERLPNGGVVRYDRDVLADDLALTIRSTRVSRYSARPDPAARRRRRCCSLLVQNRRCWCR